MVKARVYVAGNVFDPAKEARRIQAALDDESAKVKRNLQRDITNWSTPVEFTISNAGSYSRIIATDSDIYRYQDAGTPPHVIRPKTAKRLRFPVPNVGIVFAMKVNHPGTKAREWTKREAARATKALRKELSNA